MSMIDPPRAAVPDAVAKCRTAGIKVRSQKVEALDEVAVEGAVEGVDGVAVEALRSQLKLQMRLWMMSQLSQL